MINVNVITFEINKGDNMDKTNKKQIKSKERVADKGEVFTNEKEVKAMWDMIGEESKRIDSHVLEPSCGTGNFLEEVLHRKLDSVKEQSIIKGYNNDFIAQYEKLSTIAISCIYGIDIMIDNIVECRQRLYDVWFNTFTIHCKQEPNKDLCNAIICILTRNILCGNTLSMKQVNEKAQDIDLPIIISEWLFSADNLIQRKDYRYDVLVGDIIPNNELSQDYINNEHNYLKSYITYFKEVQKHEI